MSQYSYYLYNPLNEAGNKKKINKKNKLDKDSDNKEKKEKDDEPAWYNPSAAIGRAFGYVHKRFDQGFSKGYGGVANNKETGYNPSKAKEDKNDEPAWYNPISAVGRAIGKFRKDSDKGFNKGYGGTMYTNSPLDITKNRYGYDPNPKSVKESLDFKDCLYNCKPFNKTTLFNHDTNDLWHDDNADKYGTNKSYFKGPGDEWSARINEPALRAASTTHTKPHLMDITNGINKITEDYEEEPFSFKNYKRY